MLIDRLIVAHARYRLSARSAFCFSPDIIFSGHYLESFVLFLWKVHAVRNCRCPLKLESYVSCVFLDMIR